MISIRHRAAIAGHVVDAVSQRGIRDAVITLLSSGRQRRSCPDGFYAFLDLPDGSYALTATAPSLGSRYGSRTVEGILVSSGVDGRPKLDPKARLALPPTRLAVAVRRADTLAPVPGAKLCLRGANVVVHCDAAGTCRVPLLEAGAQTAIVSAPGFDSHSAPVTVRQGEETSLNFLLNSS
jgi:hypothetical protein